MYSFNQDIITFLLLSGSSLQWGNFFSLYINSFCILAACCWSDSAKGKATREKVWVWVEVTVLCVFLTVTGRKECQISSGLSVFRAVEGEDRLEEREKDGGMVRGVILQIHHPLVIDMLGLREMQTRAWLICLLRSPITVQLLQSSAVELFIVKVSVCRRRMRVVKGFSISDQLENRETE